MNLLIFICSLLLLLTSASFFTKSAEKLGKYFGLPEFVVGVFIVGVGTSLPELISGILSVSNNASEILTGNIIGANISNILLITGLAVVINRTSIALSSNYMYIDLHYLVGGFLFFYIISYDGKIETIESSFGLVMFFVYSIYLIKGETPIVTKNKVIRQPFPFLAFLLVILCAVGIYFGAHYTISSLEEIALSFQIPKSVIALTLLSLGTTLPELAVNISAIKQGKAEMAIGNILGSCVFNTLLIPFIGSLFGGIVVTEDLLSFSLPMMVACGLLFYLLTQDKRISIWEGFMFLSLYGLFIFKTI